MDYSEYAPTTKKKIHIKENLMEFGEDTWQIKNFYKISVRELKIPFEIPKPEFKEPQPRKKANLIPALSVFAGGIFLSITLLSNWIYLFAIIAALGIVFDSLKKSKTALDKWYEDEKAYKKRLETWTEVENKPQVISAVSIETPPTEGPLFYSYDTDTTRNIVESIKRAMVRPDENSDDFQIDIIDAKNDEAVMEIGVSVFKEIEGKLS